MLCGTRQCKQISSFRFRNSNGNESYPSINMFPCARATWVTVVEALIQKCRVPTWGLWFSVKTDEVSASVREVNQFFSFARNCAHRAARGPRSWTAARLTEHRTSFYLHSTIHVDCKGNPRDTYLELGCTLKELTFRND